MPYPDGMHWDEFDRITGGGRYYTINCEAERLVADQIVAIAAMKKIAHEFKAAMTLIEFPLGSPVSGYDREDIGNIVDDLLGCPDQVDWERAQEIAEEIIEDSV